MHPDLQKLLDADKVKPALAERLDQIAPGKYLLHSSWGAGKVASWDLPTKKLTIDFEKRSGQQMDLQFALQKTLPLEPDDFRARKVEEIDHLRELAKENAVELVILLLQSHGGSLTVDGLEKEVSGSVVDEKVFKKWWDSTKRALRESKKVIVPARRTEALELRSGDLTPAQALLADFEEARDLKGMAKALEAVVSDSSLYKDDPESLKPLLAQLEDAAKKGTRMQLGLALQLLSLRDELIHGVKSLELEDDAPRLANMLLAEEDRLGEAIGGLATPRQRAIYEVFPEAFGDRWVEVITKIFDEVGSRAVTEIARLVIERGELPKLEEHIRSSLARRSLSSDALIWVARERKGSAEKVFGGDVGAAILNLLETDHLADGPRTTTRLQSLLSDDKDLLADIVAPLSTTEAKNFGRRLLECPVFAELDRKSLLARIIKARPETADLVSGDGKKKVENLVVSWESLERKQAELDDLIRVRIPQNTKDISIARSYGDLRENFEYKSAKDMQKVLMRRKAELEQELDLARGTDFKGADTKTANIGTVITLKNAAGDEQVATLLGAWDSDPEKQIVSYLSEAGASLMGAAPGEEVDLRDHDTDAMVTWTVVSIAPYIS
ncbi:GreA/GreB family elongation factor [Haloferula rosea]|uniref:Transcription elongation factor GreA n=1 Tax=Haloferula rosea TaxID=490093 RepID=A0A934R6Q1_9BACT|nr:GreA/GreB family elongation factor [Haloferula rosea]MBK1826289.1 GreA/GreB family elongation factor [Haloferula rosea]